MKKKLKKMGGGAQFEVARTDEKIYKKPRKNILMFLYGKADFSQIARDIDTIQREFGDYCLDTKVIPKSWDDYLLIQDYIKGGKEIGTEMNTEIRRQLMEIFYINNKVTKAYGKSVDFLGNSGNMAGLRYIISNNREGITISNIMIIEDHLKIVDLDLLDLRLGSDTKNPLHILVDNLSYLLSHYFLKRVFGIS